MLKPGIRAAPAIFVLGTLAMGVFAGMRAYAQLLPVYPQAPGANSNLPDNNADWFRMFVGYQYIDDNNLFRLPSPSNYPDPASLLQPGASEQDHINTASAGFDGHWLAGQQSVDYDLEADDNRYVRNEYLDNVSGSGKVVWNWTLESNLSGQVGADYTRTLAGFADTFYYTRDVVDREEYLGNGRYQIGPHWAVYGGVGDAYTKNEAFAERFNDFDNQYGRVGVEFATSLQNTIGWEYRYSHGHYPDPEASLNGVPYDPDYDENSGVFLAKYALTDKTVFSGDVGYLRRTYPGTDVGAFSGDIWHLKVQWQATDKTSLLATASRDLQAYLYAQSDYFVQTGVSVSPIWVQSDKLTWFLVASWYQQNYIGSSPSVVVLGSRHDKVSTQQGGLQFMPIRSLIFTISFRHELRNSNQSELGYNDNMAIAGVKFTF
jgi:hypothetical protein